MGSAQGDQVASAIDDLQRIDTMIKTSNMDEVGIRAHLNDAKSQLNLFLDSF